MSVPTVPASSEVVQIAVNRERPPPDRARVFIATGRQPMFFDGSGPMMRHFDPDVKVVRPALCPPTLCL